MPYRILITRPEPDASELAKLMQPNQALVFPLLAVIPLPIHPTAIGTPIFVSKNAAQLYKGPITSAVAIGPSTAKILQQKGFTKIIYPQRGHGSEALLALPELQKVDEQAFTIICGTEGRNLIETTLKTRGAEVQSCCVYETQFNAKLNLNLLKENYDLLIVTSTHALHYLAKLLQKHHPALLQRPVTVLPGNMLESATRLGFTNPQPVDIFTNEHLRHLKPNVNSR